VNTKKRKLATETLSRQPLESTTASTSPVDGSVDLSDCELASTSRGDEPSFATTPVSSVSSLPTTPANPRPKGRRMTGSNQPPRWLVDFTTQQLENLREMRDIARQRNNILKQLADGLLGQRP